MYVGVSWRHNLSLIQMKAVAINAQPVTRNNKQRKRKMRSKNTKMMKVIKTGVVSLLAVASLTAMAEMVWVSCRRCNGRGLLCSTCNNTGMARCSMCNGQGGFYHPGPFGSTSYTTCYKCGGMKTTPCMDCVMTAVGCPDCGARGGKLVER